MKRTLTYILLCALCALGIHARELVPVSEARAASMISTIDKASSEMKTMQCSFVQTKSVKMLNKNVVSKGKLYYARGQKLRWEYTSPYVYNFIINGDKVKIKTSKKNDVIDVKQNKVFQEIAKIMMNSVTGKCLTDKGSFTTRMYTSGNLWVARMTPKRKEMKQVFSEVAITFDPVKHIPTEVVMTDKNGDTTTITLKNPIKDATIPASVFAID